MFLLRFFRKRRGLLLCSIDAVVTFVSCFVALFVMDRSPEITVSMSDMAVLSVLFASTSVVGMCLCGVYRSMWRYASIKDFASCIFGNLVGVIVTALVNLPTGNVNLINCIAVAGLLSVFCVILSRIAYVYACNEYIKFRMRHASGRKRVLIIGAGFAGSQMVGEFQRNSDQYEIVGFVDDNSEKVGRNVRGTRVLGTSDMIPEIAEKYKVNVIVLAIPSISPKDKSRIISICSETICEFKILPGVRNLMSSDKESFVKQLSSIKIEDLLGREQISFDSREVSQLINGSVCMVTGGGGSIGSELSRQVAVYKPKKLIIVDIYENNAYDIQQELLRKYKGDLDLYVEIASVRDSDKMEILFEKYRPEIVFHAAAHKHVPLMETNPEEAVKNNIFGTYNTAKLAHKYEVEKFVLVSTDKAVNPTNVMGATKRFCEMIVEYFAQKKSKTEFVAVRFGNVLGSNGSVIPLFEKQIAMGGPVTVTHPEIVRYFMTIPEAVSLILQAATLARGGEIFVLDMGEPVKILDLAKKMITLHGKRVGDDIEIEFSGLRPGEKLYEELLMNEEGLKKTSNHKIYIGCQMNVEEEKFLKHLSDLKEVASQNNKDEVERILHESVPTFIRKQQKEVV